MTIKQQGGIFGRNPTFNDVEVDSTLKTDGIRYDPTQDGGYGGSVFVRGGTAVGGLQGQLFGGIAFGSSDRISTAAIAAAQTGSNNDNVGLAFYTHSTNPQNDAATKAFDVTHTGNIAFPSGQGIDFSATSGTGTSELFDDYEEGTYTASLYGNTTGPGTPLPLSSSYNTLAYTKIGRQVTITGKLETSGSHSASGYLRLTVPFVGADLSDSAGTATGSVFFYRTGQLHTNPSVITGEGTSTVIFYENTAGGDVTTINAEDMDAAIEVFFGFTYFTT